jgi:hypothetical protein
VNRGKNARAAQERDKTDRQTRIEAEIEAILATEDELIPSSGFLAGVMERVQEEAALPPPMPFPWKRDLPLLLLTAAVLSWGAVELIRLGPPTLGLTDWNALLLAPPHLTAAEEQLLKAAGGVALALSASLVSWLLSRRLIGRGGLL